MKKSINILLSALIITATLVFAPPEAASAADTFAGKVVTSSGRLNVRSSPSSSSSVVTSLENSTWVTIWGKSGAWWRVEYSDGKYSWCHSDYLKKYNNTYGVTVNINSGYLNVRTGAGKTYTVQDKLLKGEDAVILYSGSYWSRILYRGNRIGYAYKSHLKESIASNTSIALSVPSYKQTDSRWSSYPIGTTGGTIGTIGCTTTALAMTESYHTGATITPVDMAKKLSYSASGSLYWPSSYSVEASGSDYISRIYALLKQGKPVVFGAKKSNGTQHWVTVTGFKGGPDNLTMASFTINDPGSSTRKTIADFMSAYPNAYKIVFRK